MLRVILPYHGKGPHCFIGAMSVGSVCSARAVLPTTFMTGNKWFIPDRVIVPSVKIINWMSAKYWLNVTFLILTTVTGFCEKYNNITCWPILPIQLVHILQLHNLNNRPIIYFFTTCTFGKVSKVIGLWPLLQIGAIITKAIIDC